MELLAALIHGLNHAVAWRRGSHVRPAGELAPLLEGEVEQGGQHLGGEFDGHPIHPIEGLAPGQGVEDARRPLANGAFQRLQVTRLHHRLHRGPLHVVLGRIHGDEHRRVHDLLFWHRGRRPQGDAFLRGELLVVLLHGHDVVELGHRPVRPELAFRAVVDRRLLAQALEEAPMGVLLKEVGVGDVDLFERDRVGVWCIHQPILNHRAPIPSSPVSLMLEGLSTNACEGRMPSLRHT